MAYDYAQLALDDNAAAHEEARINRDYAIYGPNQTPRCQSLRIESSVTLGFLLYCYEHTSV